MPANVHVIDERRYTTGGVLNRERLDREISLSKGEPGCYPNRVFTVNQAWSMDRICRRVRQYCDDQIGVLRLLSHGNASWVQLGTGLRGPEDVRSFRLLRGCWIGQYPKIVLDACGVASSTPVTCSEGASGPGDCTTGTVDRAAPAHRLLQALADAAGTLVIASYDVQWGPRPRGFEGRIHYYRPAQYLRRIA